MMKSFSNFMCARRKRLRALIRCAAERWSHEHRSKHWCGLVFWLIREGNSVQPFYCGAYIPEARGYLHVLPLMNMITYNRNRQEWWKGFHYDVRCRRRRVKAWGAWPIAAGLVTPLERRRKTKHNNRSSCVTATFVFYWRYLKKVYF